MSTQANQFDTSNAFSPALVRVLGLLLGTPPVLSRVPMPVAAFLKPVSRKVCSTRITEGDFTHGCCC